MTFTKYNQNGSEMHVLSKETYLMQSKKNINCHIIDKTAGEQLINTILQVKWNV